MLVAAAAVPVGEDEIAAGSERWRVAAALAGWAGLRLGEIRGLKWSDVNLEANELTVSRAVTAKGEEKPPKTEAGARMVPIVPALRRELRVWWMRTPRKRPTDYVVCSAEGKPVQECSLNRALRSAIKRAEIDVREGERLSWHSLRHSAGSFFATDLELPPTTLAATSWATPTRLHAQGLRPRRPRSGDRHRRRAGASRQRQGWGDDGSSAP